MTPLTAQLYRKSASKINKYRWMYNRLKHNTELKSKINKTLVLNFYMLGWINKNEVQRSFNIERGCK